MTDEELAELMKEKSDELDQLSDPERTLDKKEKKRKLVLEVQMKTLERIKEAKEKGNLRQEMKAGIDYAVLESYGEKSPFLVNFIRSQITWF